MIASSLLGCMQFDQEWTSVLNHFCAYRGRLKSCPKSMSGTSQTWAQLWGVPGTLGLLHWLGSWAGCVHSYVGRVSMGNMTSTVLKDGPCPSVWACLKLPHNEMYFGSNTPKLTCSQSITLGGVWCWFVLFLDFTLTPWWRGCPPDFSTVKLLTFHFYPSRAAAIGSLSVQLFLF